MKKSLFTLLLTIATVLTCIFGFSACGVVEFKLSFVVDNQVYATVSTSGNEVISMPENPTKDDYTFDGWYWDENTWEKPFTANSLLDAPLSSDMKVHAKFNKNQTPNEEPGISFNTLNVDGTKVYGKVSNDTAEFSFIDEITVKGNATYVVDNDKDCSSPIYSKTVDLVAGDNTFYILETIGNDVKLFTVTIRRIPMYDVTFDTNGGTAIEKQVIEEDHLATEPESPTKAGYTFTGWDYDFATPITDKTEITASWSANTDTKYTVNYYLQNLDDSNYTLHETVELTGTTDTTAYGETERYVHFTCNQNMGKISGNIDGDGSQVLSVYYTRDKYVISTARNNTKAGTVTGSGTYRFNKEITLTATTNTGYTWLGWYDGETLICETEEFTFKAEKNVTYTATWSANADTKYIVNYYLQNLDDDNYTLYENVELEGETDTTATAEIKEYTHFTYNKSKSIISGNINGDGGRVLSVYYTRNTYMLSVNNTSYGTITNNGTYKYGVEELTSTVTVYIGYNFLGWYNGETLLSAESTYTFNATQNVTAKFAVKAEMSNFNFTSTATTCSITGVKDKTVTEIIVPDYVTSISDGAFSGCSSLESITIPFVGDSRKTASDTYQSPFGYIFGTSSYTGGTATRQSYYGSSYGSSTISITSTTYYIPASLKTVTVTGGDILYGAFYNCDSLTSVVIPDSVTRIGNYAFAYCDSLTSVVIPDSVTTIAPYAFYDCDSLTSVYYKGTAEEWSKILIGSSNTKLTSTRRYYYSETQPTTSGNYWYYDENGNPAIW